MKGGVNDMVIKNINLETVCGITSVLPENDKPEIAFAGKSNVGKSSLINALMNRKSYARISATPGKTQTINFYTINEEMYLVDLPGYGYAKVSEQEKIQWGKLIERYLHTSKQLKAVFLLIDIRHDPSANDKMMYDWIVDNGYEPVIICTKRLRSLKTIRSAKHGAASMNLNQERYINDTEVCCKRYSPQAPEKPQQMPPARLMITPRIKIIFA